jgi:hypothetical protein
MGFNGGSQGPTEFIIPNGGLKAGSYGGFMAQMEHHNGPVNPFRHGGSYETWPCTIHRTFVDITHFGPPEHIPTVESRQGKGNYVSPPAVGLLVLPSCVTAFRRYPRDLRPAGNHLSTPHEKTESVFSVSALQGSNPVVDRPQVSLRAQFP